MRTLRLARVAAEAEALLLRRRLRRIAIRAMSGAVAGLFLIGVVTMLHVYIWVRIQPAWGSTTTALVLAGGDALVAVILGLFALWTPADGIETRAIAVRDQAIDGIRSAFTISAMLKPLAGILLEQWLMRRRRQKE